MTPAIRRILYVIFLIIVLALWLALGSFDAIEAPYVKF